MTKSLAISAGPRVIIATAGTLGSIIPFVILARGLISNGHSVSMLLPKFHESFMASKGIPFDVFGSGEDFEHTLQNPAMWDDRKGLGVVWQWLQSHLEIVRDAVERVPADQNCVLLCHPLLVPLADIARLTRPNLRIVCGYLAPSNLCSSFDQLTAGSLPIPRWFPLPLRQALWRFIHRKWVHPEILPSLNSFRLAHDLAPISDLLKYRLRVPDASIGLYPDWFASKQPDWPSVFFEGDFPVDPDAVSCLLDDEVETFLSAGSAPIGVTPGTGHQHASQCFSNAVLALERLNRRGLFITPYRSQVPKNLPKNILWVPQVSFSALLPRLSALIHHGGIGTMAEAIRAGIPQLIVPFAYDQFDNGLRACRLNIAQMLPARQLSYSRMQDKLNKLLNTRTFTNACAELSERSNARTGLTILIEQVEAALNIGSKPITY